jgi:hypothetical protein
MVMARKDDFTQIHGIGPGIKKRLHEAGIHTFNQLATLSPGKIHEKVGNLIGVRENQQLKVIHDWIEQAGRLAAKSDLDNAETERTIPDGHMHYASFTVKLTLDEDNYIRFTRVVDVQSQSGDGWSGWEEGRLLDFITKSTDVNFPSGAEIVSLEESRSELTNNMPGGGEEPEGSTQDNSITGEIKLGNLVVDGGELSGTQKVVVGDRPFNVYITMDLTHLKAPRNVPLGYLVMVYAKKIGGGSRRIVGSSQGIILPADYVNLQVKELQLSNGIYRIDAYVELKPTLEPVKPTSGLRMITESNLISVI